MKMLKINDYKNIIKLMVKQITVMSNFGKVYQFFYVIYIYIYLSCKLP